MLVNGGSIEDAANLLGHSPKIIRKHYAKWSTAYQQRTVELFRKIHGTYTAHEKNAPLTNVFSVDSVVPGVGLVLRPRIEKT